MEIQGQDPDFVYLLQLTTADPDYDSRLHQLVAQETVDELANEIRRAWTTQPLPAEDRTLAAQNTEAQEFLRHVRLEREAIETRLMVASLIMFMDGLQLPTKVRAFADAYKARGVKLWKNRDRLAAILKDIEDGKDPDLDAGWEAPDA
jgi:hypothetical protein